MRIFHTSDWHLGRMLYGRSLLEDQSWFLHHVFLPAVQKQQPDLILIAGDIYDRQIAPADAIRLFDQVLTALSQLRIPTAIISGNHDSADRVAILKPVLRDAGIYISTELQDALSPVTLEKDGQILQLFLLPFLENAQVRDYFQDESLRGEAVCMQRMLEEIKPLMAQNSAKFLVAHCFVAGSFSSDSESSVYVGGSGEIPASLFADFDYVALGHLHGAQKAGENGRYCGSPLKYSVDEAAQKKSFVVIDLENGSCKTELVPIAPLRDVRRITGMFAALLESAEAQGVCEDYVEILLEDTVPILLAADRLRPYFPNLLAVRNNWMLPQAAGQAGSPKRQEDAGLLFSSFMREICGADATGAETQLFEEILKEVREVAQ